MFLVLNCESVYFIKGQVLKKKRLPGLGGKSMEPSQTRGGGR